MRVHLVGNPGCGKTYIAKKIAHSWALGSWGAQFDAVYLSPVWSLNKSEFDRSDSRQPGLDWAATKHCSLVRGQRVSHSVEADVRQFVQGVHPTHSGWP